MTFRGHQGLTVWNRAVDLVELTYHLSNALRHSGANDVLADMRRSALSVPSHLAAGYQTASTKEYLRHVHAAQLDLARLETQVTILHRLDWASREDVDDLQSLMTHMDYLLRCLERYLMGDSSKLEAGEAPS